MGIPIGEIGNILQLLSGFILLFLAGLFLILFRSYRKRDYLLLSLGMLSGASLLVVFNLDVIFPNDWDSEIPDLLAGIFSFLMVLAILLVILIPDRIPLDFEERLLNKIEEEEK